MRTTHTYVTLSISPDAFEEIRAKLAAVDYGHAFGTDEGGNVVLIDMHGLALVPEGE